MSTSTGSCFPEIRERGIKAEDPALMYVEWSADSTLEDAPLVAEDRTGLGARESGVRYQDLRGARLLRAEFDGSAYVRGGAVGCRGLAGHERERERGDRSDGVGWLDGRRLEIVGEFAVSRHDVARIVSTATVSVAGRRADGVGHVGVMKRDRGTGWWSITSRRESEKWIRSLLVVDGKGPIGSLIPELEERGVK